MALLQGKQTESRKYDELVRLLSDRWWRLNNLYYIQDKEGRKIQFRPNRAQARFYKRIWYNNCILKARQLGLSTFILIYILDAILFNPNKSAGVIAQGLKEAGDLFKNKVKFAYDNLPAEVKAMVTAIQDSAGSMSFSNGSSIKVGTSLRGGTFQYLHVSEYGKIAAKYPDKAKEIKTGALNTVHVGQQIFIESTAEGQEGEFYDLCTRAQELDNDDLTPLDPRFHFFPWYEDEGYVLDYSVPIGVELQNYFASLEARNNITLSDQQKAWYAKKRESMGEDMLREYPSTPEEAFQTSIDGVYFNKEMAYLRKEKRICEVPWNPAKPVYTWWDLGFNDDTTITFTQENGGAHDVIDYYENSLEGLPHYVNYCTAKPYTYAEHNWPHDGVNTDWSTGEKRNVAAAKLGLKPIRLVERSKDLRDDHEAVRNMLPKCRFDAIKCEKLIKHLSSYRKEWNDKLGIWRDNPRHDAASHGVASFRTFATGYREKTVVKRLRPEPDDWRNS
jgi:hypothetical protein